MNVMKKKSISSLTEGMKKFENGKNAVKKSDFTDFQTFLKAYVNTPEQKQRKKLSEEFRKRHLELHEFLKANETLINAETEISKIIRTALSGDTSGADDRQLTNLFEIIGEGIKK